MTFKPNPFITRSDPYGTPIGYQQGGADALAAGALTTPDNPIHNAADATLAAAQFTDKGIEVSDGSVVRVVLGDLGGGSYGLKLYQSDGSTAIIDGTSDMFKIATTGTISKTTADNTLASLGTTTLTGLGALSTTPAHLSFVSETNTTSGKQLNGIAMRENVAFVAGSSGGSTTNRALIQNVIGRIATYLDGSSQCVVEFKMSIENLGVSATWYARYYVLQEAAL